MAQVEIRLCKNDATPWGFRLAGGADCEIPLQVIKVTEGSIAEKAGMKIVDIILCINDVPAVDLSHIQAHDVILEAGSDFVISVIRENHPEIPVEAQKTSVNQICVESMESEVNREIQEISEKIQTEIHREVQQIKGHLETEIQLSVQITEEEIRTEEEVEGNQLEETHVVKTQIFQENGMETCIQKMVPEVECIIESEVLKVLKEESIETKQQLREKDRKWSTFLQKPERSKPKDKKREEEKSKEPPYRVVIVKGKKKEPEKEEKEDPVVAVSSQGSATSATPDSQTATAGNEPDEEQQLAEDEQKEDRDDAAEDELTAGEPEGAGESEIEGPSLEEQLAAVQRQLLALSQLPAAIQQTLDVVTSQLAKIVGDANGDVQNDEQEEIQEEQQEEDDYERELDILDEIPEETETDQDTVEEREQENVEDGRESRNDEPEVEEPEKTPEPQPEPEEELTEEEKEARRIAQEKEDKKQKDKQILEELHQRRLKERPTFPLTPLQRPIFLPGGRRWKMPDDANPNLEIRFPKMSDDKIAETISAQSEVITGTTLGSNIGTTFGRGATIWAENSIDSNCGFVPSKAIATKKINFLKYEPVPVPLDHLKHSEVFKLVHDLEPAPRGIPARSGKAHAEEDYYNQERKVAPQHTK